MTSATKMWLVRAGRKSILCDEFVSNGHVALGWHHLGNLTSIKSKNELATLYVRVYPSEKEGTQRSGINQVARFLFEMNRGDWMVTYNSELRKYHVGKITSDYGYKADAPSGYVHLRQVEWKFSVDRDDLATSTSNSLGAITTLFLVPPAAQANILQVATGAAPEAAGAESPEEDDLGISEIREDIKSRAFEFIKDRILRLDWDETQELVAGILRAMGYKTRVAPPGPDRGADVIASPDGLGLEQPRIRVEVKHRLGSMGAPELRSFIGGLRSNDRGLYVSTGGFSREARYEAERATVPVTLIDIDELAVLVIDNYDKMDADTRATIPLVKIYWPAQ